MEQENYRRVEGYRRGFDFCVFVERMFKTLLKDNNRHFRKGVLVAIRDFAKDKDMQQVIRKVDRELILKRINDHQQTQSHSLEK